jgi:hypothetical protein
MIASTFKCLLLFKINARYLSRKFINHHFFTGCSSVVRRRYQLNFGIQKKIYKGKGSIKLNVDDLFYTFKQSDRITGLQLTEADHISMQDTRRIGIAINLILEKILLPGNGSTMITQQTM